MRREIEHINSLITAAFTLFFSTIPSSGSIALSLATSTTHVLSQSPYDPSSTSTSQALGST